VGHDENVSQIEVKYFCLAGSMYQTRKMKVMKKLQQTKRK